MLEDLFHIRKSDKAMLDLQGSASNEAEALEEAQEALEKVVLPTMKPIELLPRTLDVVMKQIELVEHSYGLATQVVGKGMQVRLRILPSIAPGSSLAGYPGDASTSLL